MNPMSLSFEEKERFLILCDICSDMEIYDNMDLRSTAKEYKNGEQWIEAILQGLDSEWGDIDKVAYIDNAIGKKISYSPEFETEAINHENARALWKIINSGYSVCNGISQLEKYMFDRIGIDSEIVDSEIVSSRHHVFLKLKNIKIPNVEGELEIGDTILDTTWNLAAHRYGGYPNYFCVSYSQIRESDIIDGKDCKAHKNDEELENVTLSIDEQYLRRIYTKIGIADEKGKVPIQNLIDKSKLLDDLNCSQEEKLKRQLLLLQEYQPDFAICQNETAHILQTVILDNKNLEFKKCVVNRVYDKKDGDKKAVLYVYVDLPEAGKRFYFTDKESGQFIELIQKEFEEKFECYESDKQRNKGFRPWETLEKEEVTNNPEKGDER